MHAEFITQKLIRDTYADGAQIPKPMVAAIETVDWDITGKALNHSGWRVGRQVLNRSVYVLVFGSCCAYDFF